MEVIMSMSATANISIGFRSTLTLAKIFNLPQPVMNQEECYAYLNAQQVREWCNFDTSTLTPDKIEEVGYQYMGRVVGLNDVTGYQAGLYAIFSLSTAISLMREHASEYIYQVSYKTPAGKGRRDKLRKATKSYKLYFG